VGARKAYEQLTQRPRPGKLPFYPTVVYPLAARRLGDNAGADRLSRDLRDSIDRHPKEAWGRALLDYNCGRLPDEQLLSAAVPSRTLQSEGHFHIALRRLADGDRDSARRHFQSAAGFEHPWGRAFLARIEDPRWPGWIEVKK
jgi:hypothetical protein